MLKFLKQSYHFINFGQILLYHIKCYWICSWFFVLSRDACKATSEIPVVLEIPSRSCVQYQDNLKELINFYSLLKSSKSHRFFHYIKRHRRTFFNEYLYHCKYFFKIINFQVASWKVWTLTNQNRKVFCLFEVLTPFHGTFFSAQWSSLSVGRTFLKIVIWSYEILPRCKTAL